MKIGRMQEGGLYEIKVSTMLEYERIDAGYSLPVLKGWKSSSYSTHRPPFLYLGWKLSSWKFVHQKTKTQVNKQPIKIHYVFWKEAIWVMDKHFAKHVVPVWEGDSNG